MFVGELITICASQAEDVGNRTYTQASWLNAYNDAMQALVAVRPTAHISNKVLALVVGSKQTLANDDLQLVKIYRNMGADSNTPGRAIRGPVNQEILDSFDQDWQLAIRAADVVDEYVYDQQIPKVFYVNPPVRTINTTSVEADVISVPTPVLIDDIATTEIPVDGIYIPAIREWMMSFIYARDNENSPNWIKSGKHAGNFFNLLGVKAQNYMGLDPRVREKQ